MEINDQPLTAMNILRLAFIGTVLEPQLPKQEETDESQENMVLS
jgi:hypothetical protein